MSYNSMPKHNPNPIEWLRRTEPVVNGLMQGRSNNYGEVTLSANSNTTIVQEAPDRISKTAVILFMPITANAAAEIGGGTMYVSNTNSASSTFTITHSNTFTTDRTYRYAIIG